LPWSDLIRFGLVVLRLPPDAFWSMSIAELLSLIPASGGAGLTLGRDDLAALLSSFPDCIP
jgi:uncharacterized phage protein (TIGR02216 family)